MKLLPLRSSMAKSTQPHNPRSPVLASIPAVLIALSLMTGCQSQTGLYNDPVDESIDITLAAAEKARKERAERARKKEEVRLARKRARRAATEKVADILIADYGRLIGNCFAPESEEAPGQAPLRRFMELSHEAEYGTGGGGGGGDGGGGC